MNHIGRLEVRVALCVGLGSGPALLLLSSTLDLAQARAWLVMTVALTSTLLAAWLAQRWIRRPLQALGAVVTGLKDGDFSIAPRQIEGGALGALQTQLDAFASVLRTQRLAEHEADALTRAIFAHMDVAVLAFDEQSRLSLCNPAAARALALHATVDLGRAAAELGVAKLLQGPFPRTIALTGDGLEQSRRWELRVTNVRLGGKPQTLVVLTDVQHALRDEQWRSWQNLVRVLSHEINNSLAPIGSIATTLRDDLQSEGEAGASPDWINGLNVIVRRVEALSRFLQGYAQLARLPAPTRCELDLAPLVSRAAALERRVHVVVEGGPEVTLCADPDQLEQLLINLFKNAADACLEVERRGVRVRWANTPEALTLEVEDDGPGLPDTHNLFVPFFTTKASGSGIGLVLCRQIAESHGGTLQLSNRPGLPGSIAQLRVPFAPRSEVRT